MDERKRQGDRGEEAVAAYLTAHRCRVVGRQFRCRWGEIDLIARTPEGILCFVEVKTRTKDGPARPCEAVTPAKQKRLRAAAEVYLAREELDCPCRFDVAEVYPGPAGWRDPLIHYMPGAF